MTPWFVRIMRRTFQTLRPIPIALVVLLSPLLLWGQYAPFAIIGDTHVGTAASAYRSFIEAIDEQGIRVIIHVAMRSTGQVAPPNGKSS